jgi:fructose-1,6-bisphosphatase II / sedoheptulose-1,7-bisphosphatase
MTIDKKFIDQFANVTIKAALAAYYLVGKKDKMAADKAATDSMRKELNKINMNGKVVIGEGELEGTNFVANNLPGGLSVIAVAEKNNLFNAPETYMDKIAVGNVEEGTVDLDYPIKKNISNLADAKNKDISKITACILDRPRHKKIIEELNQLKVNIKLITDGDIAGALLVSDHKYNVDIFLGIGGGPEGVLAASALDTLECQFQGRFIFKKDNDILRAKKMGVTELDRKYNIKEIVKGDSIFCATGITSGDIVKGITIKDEDYISETFITHKSSNTKKIYSQKNKINQ